MHKAPHTQKDMEQNGCHCAIQKYRYMQVFSVKIWEELPEILGGTLQPSMASYRLFSTESIHKKLGVFFSCIRLTLDNGHNILFYPIVTVIPMPV